MAEDFGAVVRALRRSFAADRLRPLERRREQLRALRACLDDNADRLCTAVLDDLRRPYTETLCYELIMTMNDIDTALGALDKWTKPRAVRCPLLFSLDYAEIRPDPLGVVLVIGAWNYPILLTLLPLVGALAAGNCAVIKPSELAPHTAAALAELLPKYMDKDVLRVLTLDAQGTQALLKERFDHIFYTGSARVGRFILQAAAEHLTPVTLELGGKCPAIVDGTSDLDICGKRIAWGKFVSAGQTCIAPDYVLCADGVRDRLFESIRKHLVDFYTADAKEADDYSRIINPRNFDRLIGLLDTCHVVMGGAHDRSTLYIEPTVVFASFNDPVMEDEIFGPILPMVNVASVDEAIELVRGRQDKPLAMYIFSQEKKVVDKILTGTTSGAVTVNDCMLHMGLDTLPFGGVGTSGMGRYHGKYTFDTFSHFKSVLRRTQGLEAMLWMRYPPLTDAKGKWARWLSVKRRVPFDDGRVNRALFWLLCGLFLGYLFASFMR